MIEDTSIDHRVGPHGFWESAPTGRMKAKEVWIGYETADSGRVTEVLVTDDAREWRVKGDNLSSSTGRCYAHWCIPVEKRDAPSFTPDQCFDPVGVFGTLLSLGFATKGVMRSALCQFAQIEECGWARRMLFAIEGELSDADLKRPL